MITLTSMVTESSWQVLVLLDLRDPKLGALTRCNKKREYETPGAAEVASDIDVSEHLISLRASGGARGDVAAELHLDEPDPGGSFDQHIDLRGTLVPVLKEALFSLFVVDYV